MVKNLELAVSLEGIKLNAPLSLICSLCHEFLIPALNAPYVALLHTNSVNSPPDQETALLVWQ